VTTMSMASRCLMSAALALPGVVGSGTAPTPAISNVTADRLAVRAGAGEQVTWRFRTGTASSVTASIYDARDRLVRTIQRSEPLPAGDHTIAWDGRDDQGRQAPPAYYLLGIDSEAGDTTARYDPSETTGGTLLQAAAVGFDPVKGLVHYALRRPSLVRIHLGLKGDGPLLRTLVDWVARDAGEQSERWDGWDAAHVVQFGDSRELDVQVWAYELPVNAVVVSPPATPDVARASAPLGTIGMVGAVGQAGRMEFLELPDGTPARPRGAARPHEMYNHWLHDRARCHNPVAEVKAPEGTPRDATGAVQAAGPLPLRLVLPPQEAASLQEERFEVVVYLDGSFVFEEEQGYLPFTWTLGPETITPGEHVVTFMLRGYEGHFGSTSIRVTGPRGSAAPAAAK